MFFSSVAARTGNAGQSDYAAANETLNRVAHYTKQRFPEMCIRQLGGDEGEWYPWSTASLCLERCRFNTNKRGFMLCELTKDSIVEA